MALWGMHVKRRDVASRLALAHQQSVTPLRTELAQEPIMKRSLNDHLFGPGPTRILALDGGGVRGALTLSYLERMETLLRERAGGGDDVRLCDYFDLIGGTSTGSIIATGLALGLGPALSGVSVARHRP
jgi:predicted acylesterase/phospholipase RssA